MKRCGILICVGERYKILKHPIRGSVGTGRRARLRILWWLHRVGSSPIFRTQWREAEPGVLFQESVRRGGKLHAEIAKNKSVRA